jgi:hypothetical protein
LEQTIPYEHTHTHKQNTQVIKRERYLFFLKIVYLLLFLDGIFVYLQKRHLQGNLLMSL